MRTPIPSLRGTPTHELAVVLYQHHHADAAGICARCGLPAPCSVRAHAASVIAVAGEDPRWYDGRHSTGAQPVRAQQPQPRQRPTEPDRTLPEHTGYPAGGRVTPPNSAGWYYERDSQ
ncbi:hypothetical protein Prum_000240 [Phytohabitans rumicis]|uniref:Uncharacterized protein n=1 Tax=Phytohabitans rumicis TaxID=1076125 RepID=A0A6V8KMI4_9ACTN|nr:hypothetical protein Prum_000240 [Phytohabitans rumicis]